MEILFALTAIGFVLCGPVALILSLATRQRIGQLTLEIERLRRLVRSIPATAAAQPAAEPVAPAPSRTGPSIAKPATPTPPARPARAAKPVRPRRDIDLEAILGGQWLTWTGILALFFGTAFFLGVDLGPSALSGLPQVLIGLAVAGAFAILGRWLSLRRERVLGLGLLGGGVALLYLAAFAAYGFHQLVPVWVAFPLLLVVAVVGALLALDRNSVAIAALTLAGALLTPMLLDGGRSSVHALLPYLFAVNLGAVVVGLRRGWAGLPLAAFLASAVMIPAWWEEHFRTDHRLYATVCVSAVWALYAISPWLRRGATPFWSAARAIVLTGNGLLYALFWFLWLQPEWTAGQAPALAVQGLLYAGGALVLRRRFGEDPAVRLTYFTGVALVILAVPVLLDAAWVTLAWTALGCLLLNAGLREPDRNHRIAGLAILALVLVRSLFFEITYPFGVAPDFRPVANEEFLGGLAVIAGLGWLAWMYHRHAEVLGPRERRLRPVLVITAAATLAWKISFELITHFVSRGELTGHDLWLTGLQALFLFWAIYGLALLLSARRLKLAALRFFGYGLVAAATVLTAFVSLAAGLELYADYRPVLNLPFLQGCAVAGVLVVLFQLVRREPAADGSFEQRVATPVLIAALLLVFEKVSFEVLGYFLASDGEILNHLLRLRSQLTLSVAWALYSGALIVGGFVSRFRPVRILGMSLLGVTVAKVFLFDIQMLDRGYRIAAFVALGVLLLAVSLLYQRQRRSTEGGS